MQIHKSKTPTKVATTLKSQPRYQSPMETQATRQTSTIMSKAVRQLYGVVGFGIEKKWYFDKILI